MSEPTVNIRCSVRGCNRLLDVVGNGGTQHFPAANHPAWGDPERGVWIEPCKKHGGVPRTIAEVDERRADRGMAPADRSHLMHYIGWAELRDAWTESLRTGRVADYRVAPLVRRL